jgi:hypothetical protein
MDFTDFIATLAESTPPKALTEPLRALWLERKGDFSGAHAIAQRMDNEDGANVHAYLHRKEGDLPNARYWYARAGRQAPTGSLDAEWGALVRRLLSSE